MHFVRKCGEFSESLKSIRGLQIYNTNHCVELAHSYCPGKEEAEKEPEK